jgi:hypothetical protein
LSPFASGCGAALASQTLLAAKNDSAGTPVLHVGVATGRFISTIPPTRKCATWYLAGIIAVTWFMSALSWIS